MRREDLAELHYITPIDNVPSILERGILSHEQAATLEHLSVAMQVIQDVRARKAVPNARKLHSYANLYICGRNPMLFKRQHHEVCVLAVDPSVLDLADVVVTDSNASSNYARFAPAPHGLSIVDRDYTFADDWRDSDQIEYWRKKAAKCAETLVPDRVDPEYIQHAYVADEAMKTRLETLETRLAVIANGHLFFR